MAFFIRQALRNIQPAVMNSVARRYGTGGNPQKMTLAKSIGAFSIFGVALLGVPMVLMLTRTKPGNTR